MLVGMEPLTATFVDGLIIGSHPPETLLRTRYTRCPLVTRTSSNSLTQAFCSGSIPVSAGRLLSGALGQRDLAEQLAYPTQVAQPRLSGTPDPPTAAAPPARLPTCWPRARAAREATWT